MTNDNEEKKAILQFVKTAYKAKMPKKLEEIPQEVKKFAEMLEKALDVRIEIQRIEMPVKKRKLRKRARKDGGNESR